MKSSNIHQFVGVNGVNKLLLLVFMLAVLACGINAIASGDLQRYSENGKLTDVENNDTVIINEKGYSVDPSVLVVDVTGRPISLKNLTLPIDVRFEYSYMETKPRTIKAFIVYIEEIKNHEGDTRSTR